MAILGCGDPSEVVEAGYIEYADKPFTVEVPNMLTEGQPFVIVVTTYGDGCISFESTVIVGGDDAVSITPFDRRKIPQGEEGCAAILISIPHAAELVFQTSGMKKISVVGRKFSVEGSGSTSDVEYELPIMVN